MIHNAQTLCRTQALLLSRRMAAPSNLVKPPASPLSRQHAPARSGDLGVHRDRRGPDLEWGGPQAEELGRPHACFACGRVQRTRDFRGDHDGARRKGSQRCRPQRGDEIVVGRLSGDRARKRRGRGVGGRLAKRHRGSELSGRKIRLERAPLGVRAREF